MRVSPTFLDDVLLAPLATEKTTVLREQGVYVFRVLARAGKQAIKRAVEKRFAVAVANVRVINVKPTLKGVGFSRKRPGRTSAYKKAYVRTKGNVKITDLEV